MTVAGPAGRAHPAPAGRFPLLGGPVRIGRRVAPSRVLFGPHETSLGDGRAFSARHVAYYRERAEGGAGVVVTETASVTADDQPCERSPLAALAAPGWARIATACAPSGTLVLAGLGHEGAQGSSLWSRQALRAPSAVPDVATRETPAVLEADEIVDIVQAFAAAARSARASGLAGVEVDAGARSLLRQFASPLTNLRSDAFGRDRLLFLVQVLTAVRAALGPGGLLGLRLCADEQVPGAGLTPEIVADALPRLGSLVDLLVVVRGGPYRPQAHRPDGHTPPHANEPLAARLRAALRTVGSPTVGPPTAVVLQGGVVDPEEAERALCEGVADLVEMTRAQIADPRLVAAVRADRPERVRPCVLCNQDCMVRDPRNLLVSCVAEPRSGYETTAPADPVGRRGSGAGPAPVLVVGGGPAGLEAARVLATAGRPVRLVERSGRLGGMLPLVAALPGRARFARLLGWWERELERFGVEVVLGVDGKASALDPELPAVVWAVGAAMSSAAPAAAVSSVEAAAVLAAVADGRPLPVPDGPALVDDPLGGPVGVGVAELLAAAGHAVTVVTPDLVVGKELARSGDLADAAVRLARAGVVRRTTTRIAEVHGTAVAVEDVHTGARETLDAAAVVRCGFGRPGPPPPRVGAAVVGDALAPRSIGVAVREGREAAHLLLGRSAPPGAEPVRLVPAGSP